ncbi:MAG: type II secretion system protein GspK [Kiritimatiellia bacterium]
MKTATDSYRNASALIVVLWVTGLMSMLVVSFAFNAHIEARITSYYRKRLAAEYLARSGVDIAEMLMAKSREVRKLPEGEAGDEEDRWFDYARRLSKGLAVEGLSEKLERGTIVVDIVPEPSRRNINRLGKNDIEKEENLERILEVGGIPEVLWPVLIDSLLDWTDKDDLPRLDGAETDDYAEMPEEPFAARNAPLDAVGELLLVRGYSRPILYGGPVDLGFGDEEPAQASGIADLLTVYGDGKVNVNAVSKRVLMTLPGIDDLMADRIIQEREGWTDLEGKVQDASFANVNDLFTRMPELDPRLKPMVSVDSAIYRLTSVGKVGDVERKLWCIVKYTGGSMTIVRWKQES